MFTRDEFRSDSKFHSKMHDLARLCGWLEAVLLQQDRIMELVGALASSRDATTWNRHWTALERAVYRHFRIEEAILGPAIRATGQHAHVVVAEVQRRQVRSDVEDLRFPSWEDDGARVRQLRLNLASHFAQEEGWSYKALARDQGADLNAELTIACTQAMEATNG